MRTFTGDDDLQDAEFRRSDLSNARFRGVNLTGAKFRGAWMAGAELDGYISGLTIWGVEVVPLINAELDRRHPERALLSATEPKDLRSGWARFEEMWTATVDRVRAMPPGTENESVDEEWSFKETMRHLVLATDAWLGLAILDKTKPFHPLGLLFYEAAGQEEEFGLVPPDAEVTLDEVLEVRAGRVAMVRDYLADITADRLDTTCGTDPWDDSPDAPEVTVRRCLGVIFNEEWQHHRYAVRDLDAIESRAQ